MPICKKCEIYFPTRITIDGRIKDVAKRRYCLTCNPNGCHYNRYTKTDEEFEAIVKSSVSIAEVLRKLGQAIYGSSYKTFDNRIKRLNISIDHFDKSANIRGKTHNRYPKIPLEQLLVNDGFYKDTGSIKSRIIKENLQQELCVQCGIIDWHGKKLSLHLDHINGDNKDNRVENLRLLCPNCHSLTDTYCGKNKNRKNK